MNRIIPIWEDGKIGAGNLNKTFCTAPWSHLTVHIDGDIKLCCIGEPIGTLVNDDSCATAWNSQTVKDVRTSLLAGTRHDYCNACYSVEDLGGQSLRQNYLNGGSFDRALATNDDGSLPTMELDFIEVRFNNLCNFKCRICNGDYSSSISAEDSARGIPGKVYKSPGTSQLTGLTEIRRHYATLTKIYFVGGEPLMMPEHWSVLEELVEQQLSSNMTLFYSTNGSVLTFKHAHINKFWSKFKRVHVNFSIDAEGSAAEYWRDGTNYTELLDNIATVSKIDTCCVGVNSTVGWPNVFSWIRFVEHCLTTGLVNLDNFTLSCVTHPTEFSLTAAPAFKKIQIRDALRKLQLNTAGVMANHIDMLVSYMDSKDTQTALARLPLTTELDTYRGKDFFTAFPEHTDMREYFK